jgi:histidyl-tRNA synthetase
VSKRYSVIKGFRDILPPESESWQQIEEKARRLFQGFGFREARLPILESTELFTRGIGASTDIVAKEMYSFADRKGRSLSLRPEGTASLVRAYLEANLAQGGPVKLFYSGPMFRYERPQKGRYRQFYQLGVEALGYAGPAVDAEIMAMLRLLFEQLEVKNAVLEINSLGCRECRPAYREKLVAFLRGVKAELCEDSQRRIEENPLRVLDCKEEKCRATVERAPSVLDYLCPDCEKHFAGLKQYLEIWETPYRVNPRIVRGLDYYNRTAFEYLAEDGLGSQNAIAAGGRYDGLVEELGGPNVPGIGFALGLERLALLVPQLEEGPVLDYFIVYTEGLKTIALKYLMYLRTKQNLKVEMYMEEEPKSLKAQMKIAGKTAQDTIIIADAEYAEDKAKFKNMKTGTEVLLEIISKGKQLTYTPPEWRIKKKNETQS